MENERDMEINSQDRHSKCEPEILLVDDTDAVRVPSVQIEVVTISEHNEYPC